MYKINVEKDRSQLVTDNPEMQCQFCYQTFIDYELIADDVNKDLRNFVMRTPFVVVSEFLIK
jgi:hypothetical protein